MEIRCCNAEADRRFYVRPLKNHSFCHILSMPTCPERRRPQHPETIFPAREFILSGFRALSSQPSTHYLYRSHG
jgi:hypothetical protein